MTKNQVQINKICLAAIFLALGWLLPFLTGQIPEIGSMLLPMHIPVFLAGFILGPCYGALIGFITPLTRSLIFGMPPIYPTGIAMSFELATYGIVSGWLFNKGKWQCVIALYKSMIMAMIAGRIVWAVIEMVLLGIGEGGFTFTMFLSGAIIQALPGIILQLILIPAIMVALDKANLVPFKKEDSSYIEISKS